MKKYCKIRRLQLYSGKAAGIDGRLWLENLGISKRKFSGHHKLEKKVREKKETMKKNLVEIKEKMTKSDGRIPGTVDSF